MWVYIFSEHSSDEGKPRVNTGKHYLKLQLITPKMVLLQFQGSPLMNAPHHPFSSFADPFASAPGRSSAVPGAPSLSSILDKAKDLQPYLRERAQATEVNRRVSAETTQLFKDLGFFKVLQPARYGGYEYGFTGFMDLISEIGRGCTSSAWACALGLIHQWLLATLPKQAQDDVWLKDPQAILCGSYAPATKAVRVEGGYQIKGKWSYASNVDNSQWALLGVHFPVDPSSGKPSAGFLLVPQQDWEIEDDWHVMGQSGTGSKSIVIKEDVFVPEHRKITFAELSSGNPPGLKDNPHPIYGIPFLSAVPVCLVAPILGTLQGAIDSFVELCESRVTRGAVAGGGSSLRDFFPVQSRLAEACAALDAATLLINRDTTQVEQMAMSGTTITVAQRIRNRRDHAYATRLAQQGIDGLFSAIGGAGLSLDQPLQRMWRDGNAISKHISLNWDAVSSMVGQHMLGLEPKGQY
jgi:resorcinol 4-hydroxylase (FADH2)